MKRLKTWAAGAAMLALAGAAQASLVGRDINGNAVAGNAASSVFLYDTVLNVTWLRNANAGAGSAYDDTGNGSSTTNDGLMTWANAKAWAANLTVGSYGGWRLPTMISNPNPTLSYAGGTDYGFNVRTTSGSTVYSEMASLWYDTLGNMAYCNPVGSTASSCNWPQPGWGPTNTGAFQNLQSESGVYWSGREYAPYTNYAWAFGPVMGEQVALSKSFVAYALAVRPGDVQFAMDVRPGDGAPAAVPEPQTYAMLMVGLAAVLLAAKKRPA